MNRIGKFLAAIVAILAVSAAQANDGKILEINDEWMPVCYYGDAKTAMQELLSLDFDPALSSEEAKIEDGVLKTVQFDENGSVQQTIEVPACEGNTGEEIISTEGDYTSEITYSCFETMARIVENAKPVSSSASVKENAGIEKAVQDAEKRKNANQKGTKPVVTVTSDSNGIFGIKVSFNTSDEDEYGNYFLYQYLDGKKPKVELLSAHYSDDQGPTLKIFCTGWSEGKEIQ